MGHPRPNKGWRATTAEHSVPLVGRDKAGEGGGEGSRDDPISPLPCSQTGKRGSIKEGHKGRARVPRSGELIAKNVERVVTTTPI